MRNLVTKFLLVVALGFSSASVVQAGNPDDYIGSINTYGFNFCPRGSLETKGQLLSIAQNTALFSLLGTTYGGDGRTTFALPNLQGRMVIGEGTGAGLQPRTLGEQGGVEAVTLTINQIPSHSHGFQVKQGPGVRTAATGSFIGESGIYRTNGSTLSLNTGAISNTGGSQPHENMSPFLVMTTCITTEGIFPSRN